MLLIQSKLVDFRTKECFGVVCMSSQDDGVSVPLSLDKAKGLGVQDIEIIDYLGVSEEQVIRHTRMSDRFARLENSVSFMDTYVDVPYERIGSVTDILNYQEVIWGYVFPYLSFITLDSEIAIQRVLSLSTND